MAQHDSSDHFPLTLPRRRFLQGSAVLASGAATLGLPLRGLAAGVATEHLADWLALVQTAPGAVESYTPVALTTAELATLKAAVARLIPTDELGPGAADAGVHIFIDRSLKGPNAALLPVYQSGLAALEKAAGSAGFAAAPTTQQDRILTAAEANKLPGAPTGFFALLLEHTRQGMFSDPIYGGNINFAGWDLIGYPGIKLVWTAAEQKFDTPVQPAHTSVAKYGGKSW